MNLDNVSNGLSKISVIMSDLSSYEGAVALGKFLQKVVVFLRPGLVSVEFKNSLSSLVDIAYAIDSLQGIAGLFEFNKTVNEGHLTGGASSSSTGSASSSVAAAPLSLQTVRDISFKCPRYPAEKEGEKGSIAWDRIFLIFAGVFNLENLLIKHRVFSKGITPQYALKLANLRLFSNVRVGDLPVLCTLKTSFKDVFFFTAFSFSVAHWAYKERAIFSKGFKTITNWKPVNDLKFISNTSKLIAISSASSFANTTLFKMNGALGSFAGLLSTLLKKEDERNKPLTK